MIFQLELWSVRYGRWVDSGLRNELDDVWGTEAGVRAAVDREREKQGGYDPKNEEKTCVDGWRIARKR